MIDSRAPHGLKRMIGLHPHAKDRLELWIPIGAQVKAHINLFYTGNKEFQADDDLQNWSTNLRTKGHAEVKNVECQTARRTTWCRSPRLVWVASCHHAVVNFGEYLYTGFMLKYPCMTHKLILEYSAGSGRPCKRTQKYLLSMLR